MFDDCLIMAGGSGTRLWPASSSAKPKQFLSIAKDQKQTFFSAAVQRALALANPVGGRVLIIAGKTHIPHVIKSCAVLKAAEKKRLVILPEPEAKNTAPAIACATVFSLLSGGGGISGGNASVARTMLVLTSDHIIQPLSTFKANAKIAANYAVCDKLTVFGIPPVRPETGYGYIETRKSLAKGAYTVAAFREKPDLPTARKFAASKRFFWNSGMFAFSTAFMADEFRRSATDVFAPFEKLKAPSEKSFASEQGLRILKNWNGLASAYRNTKNISFDYAIAEKCRQTVMVSADFDWIDIGNWEEYAKLLGAIATKSGGASGGGEVFFAGPEDAKAGHSCFVDSDMPVALAGVEDLIVVIRSGKNGGSPVALVTKKGQTQYVRDIVEQIKKAGKSGLL